MCLYHSFLKLPKNHFVITDYFVLKPRFSPSLAAGGSLKMTLTNIDHKEVRWPCSMSFMMFLSSSIHQKLYLICRIWVIASHPKFVTEHSLGSISWELVTLKWHIHIITNLYITSCCQSPIIFPVSHSACTNHDLINISFEQI